MERSSQKSSTRHNKSTDLTQNPRKSPKIPTSPLKSANPTPKKQQELTCGGQGEVEEQGSSLVEQEGHQVLQENTNLGEDPQPGTQNLGIWGIPVPSPGLRGSGAITGHPWKALNSAWQEGIRIKMVGI